MASRFWVGGTGTWDASDTTHWSTGSGGSGGASVPGSGDTVTFDGSSGGGTVTVNTDFNVTSVTMGAFTGTLDFSAHNNSPTMVSFSGTGTGARTLNMGNGVWTLTGNAAIIWDTATTTNATINVGNSVVNCTYSGSTGTRTLRDTGISLLNIKISAGTDTVTLTSTFAAGSIDFTGFGGTLTSTNINFAGNFTLGVNMTASGTGTCTYTGTGTAIWTSSGATWDRPLTVNTATGTLKLADTFLGGTTRTVTLTQGTLDLNNQTMNCGMFSSGNTNTRTLAFGTGNITLTGSAATIFSGPSAAQTAILVTGTPVVNCTYSGSTGTRTLSPGNATATGEANAISFNISAGTDTVSVTNLHCTKDINYTGFTGTLSQLPRTIFGSLTLNAAPMSITSSASVTFAATSGTKTITSAAQTINFPIIFDGVGGTWQLGDAMVNQNTITLTNGSFSTNNKNLSCTTFSSSNSNTRSITLGSSTVTLTSTGTVWSTNTTTGLTFDAGTSTIKLNDSSSSSKTFSGGALTYNTIQFTGSGTGTFIMGTATATMTINTWIVDTPPHTVQVFSGKTIIANTLTWSGTAGNLNTFQSTVNNSAWYISVPSGTVSEDYISLQDSHAIGGATFYAGQQSTDVSNNSGWIFSNPAGTSQNAAIDENGRQGAFALLNTNGYTPINISFSPTTHGMSVLDGTGQIDNGNNGGNAFIDENSRQSLYGQSSSNDGSNILGYCDSTGALLVEYT